MRKRRIIENKKKRGEWAEMRFSARAAEEGLEVNRPWGESHSYDCVVRRGGSFVSVQVKSTTQPQRSGKGYTCSVSSVHRAYRAGAFDFLAAYVIPEDIWYIIPAKAVLGMHNIGLCASEDQGNYEQYREAWRLLREASQAGESERNAENSEMEQADEAQVVAKPDPTWQPGSMHPENIVDRMKWIENHMRHWMTGGNTAPKK